MRNLRIILLILAAIAGPSFTGSANLQSATDYGPKKSTVVQDTAMVFRYIRNAISYSSIKQKIEYVKANIDSAELICNEEKIEFPSLLHLARAEYFFRTSDFRSASQEATLAMKKSKKLGEDDVLAKTMNFQGRYSLRTGFFQEGIENFTEGIIFAKKKHIKGIIPINYHGIADIYNALGNQKEYRNYLQQFINAADSENDTLSMETGYFRLGTSLTSEVRNFKMADSLLRRCLEIASVKGDTFYITLSLANLGWNYYIEKNYTSALNFYNKSLSYSVPGKIYENSANCFGNIGTIYRDMGITDKSVINYNKAIEHARLANDLYSLSWIYQDMSELYLRKRDTSNAYKNFVLFKKYSDQSVTKTNTQGLSDARIRYDADSHNKELQLLSLRLRNQRLLIYGYTGLFILSLAILLLLLSRAKINAKRRISEMNRKISEVTQANLRQQMNPHFIFNTLNSIQYYMYQHDKLATNNYLTKFSSLMRKVLENSQHTSVPLQDELDALNLYLELEMIRFRDKFVYEIKVDEEIDPLLYKVPTMLIQPYVENSICHGLMPGEVHGKRVNGYLLKGIGEKDARLQDAREDCVFAVACSSDG
jgi:tetratricopeptide (TPR) repeat protein